MKRFYTLVSTSENAGAWGILLDGKPVNTPNKTKLTVRSQTLADLIVQEWAAQGEEIIPDTMPLTQIASTMLDRVVGQRAGLTEVLLKYVDTDLLCYRTEEPPQMVTAQVEAWDPWLTWFEQTHGFTLNTTTSLAALTQGQAVHDFFAKTIAGYDDDTFTLFQIVSGICGSLILGLAFVEGALDAEQAFNVARAEELAKAHMYNEDQYGADPAQEKKDEETRRDLDAAARYLACL